MCSNHGEHQANPPYLIRLDGPTVALMTGPYLRVDIDDFDEHLKLAARAETEGTPSIALQHHIAATDLYRDDFLIDVPEAHWIDLDRAHYRTRFVATTTRAAELLVGHGDTERAENRRNGPSLPIPGTKTPTTCSQPRR